MKYEPKVPNFTRVARENLLCFIVNMPQNHENVLLMLKDNIGGLQELKWLIYNKTYIDRLTDYFNRFHKFISFSFSFFNAGGFCFNYLMSLQ